MGVIWYVLALLTCVTAIKGKCSVSVKDDLPDTEPLILNPGRESRFLYPNKNGILEFSKNEEIRLVCGGRGNRFVNLGDDLAINDTIAVCKQGKQFEVSGVLKEFKELECSKWPAVEQRNTGYCSGSYSSFEIGFRFGNEFVKVIDVCYDPIQISPLFERHELAKEIKSVRKSHSRPSFMKCPTRLVSCDSQYRRVNQLRTIGRILGSVDEAKKYIKNDTGDFLARGHLAPNADFVYGSQRRATFYYINTAPQWQTCNSQNWASLENDLRSFASSTNQDLIVYTGVHEIAQLPNKNNVKTDLYLSYANDGSKSIIPVPRFFWKVIYNEKTKLGIAFVQVNNPYLDAIPKSYKICKKIRRSNRWDVWSDSNDDCTSYTCEVDDLRNFVNFPQFPVTGLLV